MSMSSKRSTTYMAGKCWAKNTILFDKVELGTVKAIAQSKVETGSWQEKQFGAGALAGCVEIEIQREKENAGQS